MFQRIPILCLLLVTYCTTTRGANSDPDFSDRLTIAFAKDHALKMVRSVGQFELLSSDKRTILLYKLLRSSLIHELKGNNDFLIVDRGIGSSPDRDAFTEHRGFAPVHFIRGSTNHSVKDLAKLWIHEILHHFKLTHAELDKRIDLPSVFEELPRAIEQTHQLKENQETFYSTLTNDLSRIDQSFVHQSAENNAGYYLFDDRWLGSWVSGYHDCSWKNLAEEDLPCLKIDYNSGLRLRVIFQKNESVYVQRLRRFLEDQRKNIDRTPILMAPMKPWHPAFGLEEFNIHVSVRVFGLLSFITHFEHVTPYPKTLRKHDEFPPTYFEFSKDVLDEKKRAVILKNPELFKATDDGTYQIRGFHVKEYSPKDAYYFDQISVLVGEPETKLSSRTEISLKRYLSKLR